MKQEGSRLNLRREGFTLLELAMVVLIMGIVMAFAIPRLGSLTDHNLTVSCRRLSGTVRYLMHRSTVHRTIYRLNCDFKTNDYWITYREKNLEFVEDPSVLAQRIKLPSQLLWIFSTLNIRNLGCGKTNNFVV